MYFQFQLCLHIDSSIIVGIKFTSACIRSEKVTLTLPFHTVMKIKCPRLLNQWIVWFLKILFINKKWHSNDLFKYPMRKQNLIRIDDLKPGIFNYDKKSVFNFSFFITKSRISLMNCTNFCNRALDYLIKI